MLRILRVLARLVFIVVVLAAVGVGGLIGVTLVYFGRDLPDYQQIADYVPAVGSKVYADDGRLMTEFETEHRIPVTIGQVPKLVIQAFLAAEDRDFYSHNGVNPIAIARAGLADVLRLQRGQRPIGASTITQQVVRHFLLTNQVSIARKVKEALLAYRIEHTLTKDRILEIYLNEIYFGAGAYGVAAAADTYFQKPLDKLTLAETAFLAALPKAPNNYNPLRHAAAAKARRDWVLAGMAEIGWVPEAQARAAMAEPLNIHLRNEPAQTNLAGTEYGYFAEEVRRELIGRFGEKAVYEGGLRVRTSYNASYQQMAEAAFRKGLIEYDRRHGWRGPLTHQPNGAAAQAALTTMADPPGIATWRLAAVVAVDNSGATISLKNGGVGRIPFSDMQWARRTLPDQRLGAAVRRPTDVVVPGDIVLVEPVGADADTHGKHPAASGSFALRQIPDVSGAVVVMDPKTGRVFSLVGGWSFRQSQFNRATQALRQPGSAFKPFVYVTALQNGFTPDSPVEDAPIEISQGPGQAAWSPVNYEGDYVGTTTLEEALVHSRNLATVHVAQSIGLPAIAKTVQAFDIMDRMPLYYSMALGAGDTTLLRLTNAYAMLDNGGHWLLPSVIDLVQDRNGRIVYQKGVNGCSACFVASGTPAAADPNALYQPAGPANPSSIYIPNARYADNALLFKPKKPDPLVTPEADADIIDMMQGVVERGTGIAVAAVGKPLAGKTGTTSDWFDAWFVGFSPDLVAGVFVGFDEPRTLGTGEVGGHVAAPIFRDFMMAALKDKPAKEFSAPEKDATAVIASASTKTGSDASGKSPSTKSRRDLASLENQQDDPTAAPGAGPALPGSGATGRPGPIPGPISGPMPPPAYPYRGYAATGANAYVPPRMPAYPAPWSTPYPGGAPYAGYPAPAQMPAYPTPAWGGRPSFGTGGLY